MTLDDSILTMRLRVMRRAQELHSVTLACQEAGISRTVFYRWLTRFERYGADGLHPRRRQARPGRPRQIAPHIERLILGVALAWPTWGCGRTAAHLAREFGTHVAPATVQRILRRSGLPRRRDRLGLLEHHSAGTCGLLTERTRRQLARARGARSRHVHATQPGELVCLDTFYIGKLKGVGKVWQITACEHTRTLPRHAWTNGFVERLQGTILHEHWRIEFRRQYFTSRRAMQRSLDAFMKFYNERRPHQGYVLRGRTPAELFVGVAS